MTPPTDPREPMKGAVQMKLYEKITADTWLQGALSDYHGRMCLAGHLIGADRAAVARIIRTLYPERLNQVRCRTDPQYDGIGDFNDHGETTLEDVLRVCKLADV